jgi:hypothetical protein
MTRAVPYTASSENKPRGGSMGLVCFVAVWFAALACGSDADPPVARVTISGVECLDDAVACGDDCARLASSAAHCGGCDTACSDGELCDQGRCAPLEQGCSGQSLLCGSDCVDASGDREHCGSCDVACPTEGSCEAGSCICAQGLSVCGDTCADLQADEQHCGVCGTACVDSQTCEAGSCQCPENTELCGALCVDTATDGQNCGSCGVACVGGQSCDAGSCVCPDGALFCSDRCVDPATDTQNCGGCGTVCAAGQVCDAAECVCPEGQSLCGEQCVDTQVDPAHCGSCDVACGLGEGCSTGACTAGAFGEDGCEGLVRALAISQVSALQTVDTVIARDGVAVPEPEPAVVALRPTLFRAFVAPAGDWVQREVSARLHLSNGPALTTEYSTAKLSPVAASQPDDRQSAFEFQVPADLVTPETRFALEVVECDREAEAAGTISNARFPASDGADLRAVFTGGIQVHFVPMRSNATLPDTSEQALALYRAAFLDTYPISSIEFTVGEPFDVDDAEDWSGNLDSLRALRQQENPPADVYYYGLLKPAPTLRQFCGNACTAGVGYVPDPRLPAAARAGVRAAMGLAYVDDQTAFAMLHEVAHNHGRQHAPCVQGGTIDGIDPDFPQTNGSTGGYGYNYLGDQLIGPDATDLMGYCPNQWLSAYTYSGLLDAVIALNQVQASEVVSAERIGSWRVLLLDSVRGARWGHPIRDAAVAAGDEEPAQILDAAGQVIQTVTVYRTRVSDLEASSIQVPEPQPGWSAIQVNGAAPVAFGAR